ncbi:hypothetical protein F4604DRAFT_1961279, partial [Suillus subluteus]
MSLAYFSHIIQHNPRLFSAFLCRLALSLASSFSRPLSQLLVSSGVVPPYLAAFSIISCLLILSSAFLCCHCCYCLTVVLLTMHCIS